MTENLERWNRVKQPPTSALKPIKAGKLKGMSDISPQWRLQAMTEEYGEIGHGWYYVVEKTWTVPGANDELMYFVQVNLYTKDESATTGWSAPIAGQGGSKLINNYGEKGLQNNDEALKMAVTDALGVAMKQLGFAADIYLGLFDGSKYVNAGAGETPPTKNSKPVDEMYPPSSEAMSVDELKKTSTVDFLKESTGKAVPQIMKAINGLDKERTYTLDQVKSILEAKK